MYPLGIGGRFYNRTLTLMKWITPVIAEWVKENKKPLAAIAKVIGIAFVGYFCMGYIQTEALSLQDDVGFLGELGEFLGLILMLPAVLLGFNSGLVMKHSAQVPVVAGSLAIVVGIFILPASTALALFSLCISVRSAVHTLKGYINEA